MAKKDYEVVSSENGIETRKQSGKIETFDDKTLSPAIDYSFEYDVPLTIESAKTAGLWPNDGQILASIATDEERSAKATAYQQATAKLREAKMATPEFKLEQFIKNTQSMGMDRAQAEAFVASTPAGAKLIAEIAGK
jgi:hypothetical protein